MSCTVEFRPDNLFERAREGCPPEMKGTFIETNSIPVHLAIQDFLEQELVGKSFKDKRELQEILNDWPNFARGHGVEYLDGGFRVMSILDDIITCPGGMGSPLVVAYITETA